MNIAKHEANTSSSSARWVILISSRPELASWRLHERWRKQSGRTGRKTRSGGARQRATDAPGTLKTQPPYRHHPRSSTRTLPRSQWGLQFIVLRKTQLQKVPFYSPFLLLLRQVRFCRLSCETRRDLVDAARTSHTSHTQPFLDPACAVISFRL